MTDPVTSYFSGEKRAGAVLSVLGAVLLVWTVLAWDDRRLLSTAIGVLALFEITIGVGLFLRTGPQVRRLKDQRDAALAAFIAAEDSRMTRVQHNFVVVKRIEIAVGFLALAGALVLEPGSGLREVALGLLVHAVLLFIFDVVAERRGAAYLLAVREGRVTGEPIMCANA